MDGFSFVSAIESALSERGISKSEFYKATGISSATFSQWRNRVYSPSSSAIRKVEEFLGVTMTFEQKEKPSTLEGEELGYYDIELLTAYRLADASTKEAIQRILRLR